MIEAAEYLHKDEFDPHMQDKWNTQFREAKVIVLMLTQSDYRRHTTFPNLPSVDYDRELMKACFEDSVPGKTNKLRAISIHNPENRTHVDDVVYGMKKFTDAKQHAKQFDYEGAIRVLDSIPEKQIN